jgi:hypothetical protein
MDVSKRVAKSHTSARAYCKCGGAMKVSAPTHVVQRALEIFWEQHRGDGHGACNAATAARERRRQDTLAADRSSAYLAHEADVATWESLGRGFIEHEPDETYGAAD